SIAGISPAAAQRGSVCGDPPRMEDLRIKAEVEGKASLLIKYIGDAGFKGAVEVAKEDVLQKYPKADELRLKMFYQYQVCHVVLNSTKLTDDQKLKEIKAAREAIFPPQSGLEELRKDHSYIDDFELHDRVLAASAILINNCGGDKTLWVEDV